MGLFGWINRREVGDAGADGAASVPAQVGSGSYGERVVSAGTPNTALTVAAFYRAVELRAKTMSQLVIEYQRKNKEGGNFVADMYGDSGKLNYLLQVRPNYLMTAAVLMQQAEISIMLQGNAYIWIQRDRYGMAAGLWLASGGTYDQQTDQYTLTVNTRGGVKSVVADSHDVIHIPNTFRGRGGFEGIPTLQYARRVLGIAATNDQQALENSAKGGRMKILIQEKDAPSFGIRGRANKEQLQKIQNEYNKSIYDNDVILMNNIVDAKVISQTAQQMDLLASRGFSVAEVARVTGVPKAMLMDDSGSSYKTPEAATQEFLLRTIQPKILEWEQELDSKLLLPGDFRVHRFHLCERLLHRLDPQGQSQIDKTRLETGVKSVNELRAQYDLPTIEGGDIHYISTNLAEVGSEKLRGNSSEAVPIESKN
jgi:HK97 family phage portal protein